MFLKITFWVKESVKKVCACFDAMEKVQTEDGVGSLLEMLLMVKKLLITGDIWLIDFNHSFDTFIQVRILVLQLFQILPCNFFLVLPAEVIIDNFFQNDDQRGSVRISVQNPLAK